MVGKSFKAVTACCRFLDSVPPAAIEHFRTAAERLVEERGAVEALAAALAHISGATSLEQRSLLNSDAVSILNLSNKSLLGIFKLVPCILD